MAQYLQPPPGLDPSPPPPPSPKSPPPWRRYPRIAIAAICVVALFVAVGIGVAIGGGGSKSATTAAPTVTVTVPAPGPTVTQTVPGPTVTKPVPGPTVTVTKPVPGPTVTVAPTPSSTLSQSGSGDGATREFRVTGNYDLVYSYSETDGLGVGCYFGIDSYQGTELADVLVNETGTGVANKVLPVYTSGGTYHLKISSTCGWSIAVRQTA